jgi:hypothetical protein
VALVSRIYQLVSGRIRAPLVHRFNPASMPVFAVALVCITGFDWHVKQTVDGAATQVASEYRSFAEDLRRDGGIDHGSSLLFLRDPFATDLYDPDFIAFLLRKQHKLRAARAKVNQVLLAPAIAAKYDNVFDFEEGHLHRIAKPDLAAALDRVGQRTGVINPVSGFYLTDSEWWWTQKDFAVEARCPSAETSCEFAFDLKAPGDRNISIEVGGIHWRDVMLPASPDASEIDVRVPAGAQPTRVRFRVDRAVDPSQLNGDQRELAVIFSGVRLL